MSRGEGRAASPAQRRLAWPPMTRGRPGPPSRFFLLRKRQQCRRFRQMARPIPRPATPGNSRARAAVPRAAEALPGRSQPGQAEPMQRCVCCYTPPVCCITPLRPCGRLKGPQNLLLETGRIAW